MTASAQLSVSAPGRPVTVRRRLGQLAALLSWAALPLMIAVVLMLERKMSLAGHPELRSGLGTTVVYCVAAISSGTVGVALALRRPRHPVGWCFLGLSALIGLSGVADSYTAYVFLARAGDAGPFGYQVAVVSDGIWLAWFAVLSVILQLTPTGRPLSPRWRVFLPVSVAVPLSVLALKLVMDPATLEEPYRDLLTNPWYWAAGRPVVDVLEPVLGFGAGLTLVLSAGSLLIRFRRARDEERQQLKWLALAAFPLPLLVVVSYQAAWSDNDALLVLATSGLLTVIPVSAGLSISRYHLYDVDRILSRALTYVLLSIVLLGIYAGVVLAAAWVLHGASDGSELPVALGAVCAAGLATPLHRRFQQAVDRRFNRRQYDTMRAIERFMALAPAGPLVDDVLRTALEDPGLTIAYLVRDEETPRWVNWEGVRLAAEPAPGPGQQAADIERDGRIVARVRFDPDRAQPQLVRAALARVSTEIENVALRSAVALQLDHVRRSRARIVQAQHAERTRIERDLHDGAQQRLLAVAFGLGAARLKLAPVAGTDQVQDDLQGAVQSLQVAVSELRQLANGLRPAALEQAGLEGALEELAARTPVPIHVSVQPGPVPLAADVEVTAWFIALEAVTNAVKHADPARIDITVGVADGQLLLEVRDDGCGGADPSGSGLRGLADRAEALGGSVTVSSLSSLSSVSTASGPGPSTPGTVLRAQLPCGS